MTLLSSLAEFARRRQLVDQIGHESVQIGHVLVISPDGKLLAVEHYQEKGKRLPTKVVRLPGGRSTGVRPTPFCDGVAYVLGVGLLAKAEERKRAAAAAREIAYLQAFREQVAQLAQQSQDVGALAVHRFYQQFEQNRPLLTQEGAFTWVNEPEKNGIAFRLGEELVHRREELLPWLDEWRRVNMPLRHGAICSITGQSTAKPQVLHGRIRVRSSAGDKIALTALVSHNQSHLNRHLGKGETAPNSPEGVAQYLAAINYLTSHGYCLQYQRATLVYWLADPELLQQLQEQLSMLIEADLGLCLRVKPAGPEEKLAPEQLGRLDQQESKKLKQLLSSPRQGTVSIEADMAPFHAVALSANEGRGTVKGQQHSTLGEVQRNLQQYWIDLGAQDGCAPSLRDLADALLQRKSRVEQKAAARTLRDLYLDALWRCALMGAPLAPSVRHQALMGMAMAAHRGDWKLETRKQILYRLLLLGRNRDLRATQKKEFSMSLDEANREPSYLWGRMFATLEELKLLQYYQEDVRERYRKKETWVAKVFKSAMFDQRATWLRLMANHGGHEREQASKEAGALVKRYLDLMDELHGFLDKGRLPDRASRPEQELFVLGYMQQRGQWKQARTKATTDEAAA
jgi:CRISPR-associated protein Cas8c/Csd1 subtype I-C